ncbi:zinc metallopeptidase [Peptoniphilaceae bacterium SGI.131]
MSGNMTQTIIYIGLLLAVVLSLYAQFKVTSNYNKYSEIQSSKAYTGAQVARLMLDRRGIYDVQVTKVEGNLTDHYDPSAKVVRLSQDVYEGSSISSVSIAAHEIGHAIQHNEGYAFLTFRSLLAPAVQFTSKFVFVLIIMGIFFRMTGLIDLGIAFYSLAVLFQIITLPVEFDASRRALENLEGDGIITLDERRGARRVLGAAALTYVAAMAVSLLQLLRLIAMRNRRD